MRKTLFLVILGILALGICWYFLCQKYNLCGNSPIDTDNGRLQTLQLTEGDSIILSGFDQFAFDTAAISPQLNDNNRLFLDTLVDYLHHFPEKNLTITALYRQSEVGIEPGFYSNLGIARAIAVRHELMDRGIAEYRFTIKGGLSEDNLLREPILFEVFKFEPDKPAEGVDVPFIKFPWPPPQASATVILPPELLKDSLTEKVLLGDVDDVISRALQSSGYVEKSYFSVPDGFALVTRLEQINSDGTPKAEERWSTEVGPLRSFSLEEFFRALLLANPGFFRTTVFVITPHPFSQADVDVPRDIVEGWLREGLNILPHSIAELEYDSLFTTTALIYEFEQPRSRDTVFQSYNFTGIEHLTKSGIMSHLNR